MNIFYSFLFSWWAVIFIYGVGPILFLAAWRERVLEKRKATVDRPAQTSLSLLSSSLVLWVVFLVFPAAGIPAIGTVGSYSSWVHAMLTVNLLACAAGGIAGLASRRWLKVALPITSVAVALHWVRVTIP